MTRGPIPSLLILLLTGCGAPSGSGDPVGRATGGPLSAGAEAPRVEREPLGASRLVARPSASQVVSIRVVFDAGSAEDAAGREGITHLTARLMLEGGTSELNWTQIAGRLFPMAAELDVHTGRDQTVFTGRVHRDHLEAFYALFRELLARPRMRTRAFERILAQTRSELELELRGNDDEELGKEILQAMFYEGHPFGHPVLGSASGLASLRVDDLRAHRTRVFCGARALVGVAGGYPEGFAERLRDDVSALEWDSCVGRRVLPAVEEIAEPRVWLIDKDEAASVAISMGMTTEITRAHRDYPAMVLAAAYLGQHRQFAGVLMQRMRGERGLNYGDYAYAEHFEQQGWTRFPLPNTGRRQQYYSIWIRPVRPEQAHFAARMAVRELRRFVEEGLPQADFERIRSFVDRYYALYLQTESRRLGFAIDDAFYGVDEAYLQRLRAAWRTLTVEEVNSAIRRHVRPERLQMAVVTSDAEAFADALASEAPSPIEYPAEVSDEVLAEDREIVPYRVGVPRERMTIVPVAETFR